MRLRILTVSVLAAAAATLPLAGVASAQPGDRDCADFSSQADAQEALDGQIGDPDGLDANDDGQACENFDYDNASQDAPTTTAPTPSPTAPPVEESADGDDGGQVSVIPRGGVDTGDGSGTGSSAPLLVGGVLALGAAAAVARRRAHGVR